MIRIQLIRSQYWFVVAGCAFSTYKQAILKYRLAIDEMEQLLHEQNNLA